MVFEAKESCGLRLFASIAGILIEYCPRNSECSLDIVARVLGISGGFVFLNWLAFCSPLFGGSHSVSPKLVVTEHNYTSTYAKHTALSRVGYCLAAWRQSRWQDGYAMGDGGR